MLNKAARLLGTLVFAALACATLFAQSYTGRILGTVTDPSGAALSGATVTITDVARGTTRTITTDDAGAYVAPNLLPGTYKVRAEAKGFKSVERPNIELEVAKDALIDLSLPTGNVSETVQVTDEVPLLDTTSATLGGTLSNAQINDLPLNGRNYENLLQLRPGVVRYPGGGFSTTSTNGLRAEDNGYVIDGLFNSEPYSGQGIINGAGIAGDSATILPIDSIQEFNVQENPPAEYGWKPGAVVNVGIKSGTNAIHGTAFAFGRDGALDARNYFNTAPNPKNPRTLEQWGGSFGGALKKDKLFYFGSYEQQTYTVGNSFGGVSSPATVPLADAGNCIFGATGDCVNSIPNAIADLQAGGFPISPVSLQIAGCTLGPPVTCNGLGFPTNNGTNPNGVTAIVNGFPNDVTSRNAIGKVDYHFNDRNTITGLYFFGNNSGTVEDFPELQPIWLTLIHTRAQVVGGSWTWIPSSRWVNEVRAGYNRLYQPTYAKDHNTPASNYGLDTGVPFSPLTGGLPRIGFFGEFQTLGGFKWPKLQGPDTIIQFIDHVSYTAGKHAIKFGGEVHRNGVNGAAYGNARGAVNFGGGAAYTNGNIMSSALEDFFAGDPTNASILSGNPNRSYSSWGYAAFIQDDWRATKSLTLNFGMRYELNTVIKEAHNELGNFDPNVGLVQVGVGVSSPYQGNHTNFAPRAGFAWDVTGKGNTVIRGGAGVYWENVNSQTYLAFNNSFGLNNVPTGAIGVNAGAGNITSGNISPNVTNSNWNNGPVFPTGTISCDPVTASPCSIFSVDRHITTPYVTSWTMNLQHAFNPNLSLEVAYVGNHGSNLINVRDINQPPPDPNGAGVRPFATKFPFLQNIFQMGNLYQSNYNALQATVTARNYHGLGMVLGYTWGHAQDNVGANWDFGYGSGLPQDSFNVNREYANSDFDVRQRLTASITYALPSKKGYGQMLEGWELNSIVTLDSPQPWGTIDLGTNIAGTGSLATSPPSFGPDRWNFYGNTNDFKARPTPIPFFPGNGIAPNTPPTNNAACNAQALALDGGNPNGFADQSLATFGCYARAASILIPPPFGQFGTSGRNIFPDAGFRNWDFSVAKKFHFGERVNAQFRAEFFNILNHPNFANPYGGQNGYGQNDPSVPGFGCSCATPDVAAANPVIGSGGSRAIQLGLKFIF